MPSPTPKVVSTEALDSKDAKWLKLVRLNYQHVDGKVRTWEGVERTTRPKESAVDAVFIVAVLERPGGPELLLQKQFRPPLDNHCIELPAGLVDGGETPEQAAVRELREETGYVGKVIEDRTGTRPVLFGSPGMSNACSHMIHVKVDMAKPENQDPKPQLEEGEFIECFSVPLKDLYAECRKLHAQGFSVDGKLGSIAEGIEMAKAWQL